MNNPRADFHLRKGLTGHLSPVNRGDVGDNWPATPVCAPKPASTLPVVPFIQVSRTTHSERRRDSVLSHAVGLPQSGIRGRRFHKRGREAVRLPASVG